MVVSRVFVAVCRLFVVVSRVFVAVSRLFVVVSHDDQTLGARSTPSMAVRDIVASVSSNNDHLNVGRLLLGSGSRRLSAV